MTTVFDQWHWQPSARYRRLTAIEMHTGGEPLRIFTGGLPELPGETVLEKRRYFRDHYDHLRTATMWEPRGHADVWRGHHRLARCRPRCVFPAQRGLQHDVWTRHHRH